MRREINIVRANPASSDAQPLLEALWAFHQARTPVEGQFWLGVEALSMPDISFFLAYSDGQAIGCAAYSTKYSELKSMFVTPQSRGTGAAHALIEQVEHLAKAVGILRLETGPTHHSALKFYKKLGFTHCKGFGPYGDNDYSVCMAKTITKDTL